ncbi:hypothetical protein QO003_003731 [Arthrobacter silviterrae]|uniref:Uncharacterized protein n=1 Tax=Arthrobacter silviterrae TaxID=2026658 RepID=A0ABX0D5H6_9MICC|nr:MULTISPECIES: hypothetical protein [Arthrobacter]MCU6480097.1 hypothetical protein [Arthrobacter sp. A2-55]MDQ0279428.1 hypothetical protein [Arthrobacter silviterrae]NGN82092.1 hypothetical protein [Arthrobacter silviterrae]
MSFESHSMTLKIWDHSTMEPTLESAITHISARANAPKEHVRVVRSGPNMFTVSVGEESHAGFTV